MAGEKEEFISKASSEIVRRRSSIDTVIAGDWAKEMWSAAESINKSKRFRYKVSPWYTLVRGCKEANWGFNIADKTKKGAKAPAGLWTMGPFHMRLACVVYELEEMGVQYEGPLFHWLAEHPKQYIWAVTRYHAKLLDRENGRVTGLVDIYFYGYPIYKWESQYHKEFREVYENVRGKPLPKVAVAK